MKGMTVLCLAPYKPPTHLLPRVNHRRDREAVWSWRLSHSPREYRTRRISPRDLNGSTVVLYSLQFTLICILSADCGDRFRVLLARPAIRAWLGEVQKAGPGVVVACHSVLHLGLVYMGKPSLRVRAMLVFFAIVYEVQVEVLVVVVVVVTVAEMPAYPLQLTCLGVIYGTPLLAAVFVLLRIYTRRKLNLRLSWGKDCATTLEVETDGLSQMMDSLSCLRYCR